MLPYLAENDLRLSPRLALQTIFQPRRRQERDDPVRVERCGGVADEHLAAGTDSGWRWAIIS